MSVMLKKKFQPLTPSDINLKVRPEKIPHTVIIDGVILEKAIVNAGYDREWLEKELQRYDLTSDKVYLGQIDTMENCI